MKYTDLEYYMGLPEHLQQHYMGMTQEYDYGAISSRSGQHLREMLVVAQRNRFYKDTNSKFYNKKLLIAEIIRLCDLKPLERDAVDEYELNKTLYP
jgi:hypothetical protein